MLQTVIMVARIRVLAGSERRFETIFAGRRARAQAHEPGTLRYDLFGESADPLVYTVIEEFVDAAAVQAHLDASIDHEELMACFDGKPEVHTLFPISTR